MLKKLLFGGGFLILLFIVGFIFLLRSCLAKYDERSMISHPLLFEKNGQFIIFSLVKFDQTTSYSQNGGFISKSVSTSYSIQTNDAMTGEEIKKKSIKEHSDVKSYPVEIMGSSAGKAWVFAGEPMAFDPFSFEKLADIKMMEAKNPSLAGKFSNERKYYELDTLNKILDITLKDGSKYHLSTGTLLATASNDEDIPRDAFKAKEKMLESALKELRKNADSNYRHYMQLYSSQVPGRRGNQAASLAFEKERKRLDDLRDSIYALQRESNDERSYLSTQESRMRSLQSSNTSFGSIKSNADSFLHQWYGLYTQDELDDMPEQFDYRSSYNDVARNKLFKAAIAPRDSNKKYTAWLINKEREPIGNNFYLQGGFLLNRQTAMPYHLNDPAGFLIVHKEEVGNAAKIIISRIDINGRQLWSFRTGLKDISYWVIFANRLIITGPDNKELSSGENNVLHTIDLKTGNHFTYDFFTGKMRKPGE